MPAYWFNPEAIQGTAYEIDLEGSIYNRIILSSLILAAFFILFYQKVSFKKIIKNNKYFFLYFFYCGLSIIWSDYSWVSFKRYIKEVGNILMVFVVLTEKNYYESIKSVIRKCCYILIPLSVVFIKFFPGIGRGYHRYTDLAMYNGAAISKNALALLSAVSALFFTYELINTFKFRKCAQFKLNIIILLMSFWLLFKAESSSSKLCFILGFTIIIFYRYFNKISFEKIALLVLVLFFPVIIFDFKYFVNYLVSFTESSNTFWGRVENWSIYLSYMDGSPLIGEGFHGFWLGDKVENISKGNYWVATQAHNGYLEIYLELGIIGLILFLFFIIPTYFLIKRRLIIYFDYGVISMSFIGFSLMYNIVETGFKGLHLSWFILLLFSLKYYGENVSFQ